MPVYTPRPDTTSTRLNSDHVATRWNTPQTRFTESERRRNMSEVVEMDGTGLYERENWPLVETTEGGMSPDTAVSAKHGGAPHLTKSDDENSKEGVALRKTRQGPPATLFDDKNVSDIEEESDEEESDTEESDEDSTGQADYRQVESRGSSPIEPTREGAFSGSTEFDDTDDQAGEVHTNENLGARIEQRERRSGLRTTWRLESGDASPVRHLASPGSTNSTSDADDSSEDESSPPEDETKEHHRASADVAYQDEQRESTTPIPSSIGDPYDESPPSASSPPAYGRSPNANGHFPKSSITKITPPSQDSSRQSTQMTSRRERVRYSWQSVQDDEPNRPRIHIVKLVSNTATASAGFPQGEAFGFSLSPRGKRLAAYNSARLYILQTAALPVGISQDFALRRRPLAVEIVDEGNALAILVDEHTINIYDLGHQQIRRIKTVKTDFPTNCISLSPTAGLLAAAYEGGVEVFSLSPNALPTDRRAVRCPRMDRLTFSEDSSTLLGTTIRINVSSTMVVSVPVFPSSPTGTPTHDELKEAWCSELLHPENIRNSSHAAFMRVKKEPCNERLFAWNGLEDTFGVLNTSDLVYGNVDFPVVISPPLSTCGGLGAAIHSCPAIDEQGDTVAMVVNDRTIRLYVVPHAFDDSESTIEAHSIDHELDEGYGCPFSEVRWVYGTDPLTTHWNNHANIKGRLVVTSPGGVVDPTMNEESIEDVEGGRIILFDFDSQFAGQAGQTFSLTLGKSQPQLLEEPEIDVAEEVALVRRRTVNQNKGGLSTRPITLGRAASTFGRRDERPIRPGLPNITTTARVASRGSVRSVRSEASRSLPDLLESSEAVEAFEEPYAQNAPRSQASLQRAASNVQRHRFQTLEEKTQERVSAESTGNILPLPEYTEEPNAPLPSRFRALAGLDTPTAAPAQKPTLITTTNGDRASVSSSSQPTSASNALSNVLSAEQASHAERTERESERANTGQRPVSRPPSAGQGLSPISRSDTSTSVSSMPRYLQRAYSNAAPFPGARPPSSMMADRDNVSPISGTNPGRQFPQLSQSSTSRSGRISRTSASVPEPGTLDPISPSLSNDASLPPRISSRSAHRHRNSTSLLGFESPIRADSTASAYGAPSSPSSTVSSRTRRMPAHTLALQSASANNASGSLFPSNQPVDHVPVREPAPNAGSMPHPVTAWHPPAPSIASAPPMGRGHSRKNSLSTKSAFASTTKAKKLGFFRTGTTKTKKQPMFGPEFANAGTPSSGGHVDSTMETKSMSTDNWSRGEGKCAMM